MKTNKSYIGNVTVSSNSSVIVYGSVRGLASEHRSIDAAVKSLEKDRKGCKSQGGYSDAAVYVFRDGAWELKQVHPAY